MTSGVTRARATLDAWREHGADRLDPIRFHFIEALDRRAAGHSGEARRILDDKLSKLLAAYAGDLERAGPKPGEPCGVPSPGVPSPGEPARGALAGLIDHIAGHAPMDGGGPAAANAAPRRPAYPELEVLDYFRDIWSGLSTQRQLRQSLEQVPGNAGPLNSSSLVHRSLSLMRELSPGYLQQFLSYVDALSWMEQMNGGGVVAGKDAPRAGNARKSARGKAR
ncbi:DUF2894 domain-containing protein [Paraburkholderia lacunae]|uniref:DUF2894 domain-containing protein n=1 Tax=Paraburkholderia lacunae TaxID=2211104 RepID=A0A370NAX9_9BURK|nr:DUF2894 domain-containing protein [Paraburkholderia lacunae]RDK02725.1 DUF2894 domain-containing protein [Paraburkholderia lacunae]